MSKPVGPGRASLVGLAWLASVGPVSIEAWRVAMTWSERTAFSHAERLTRAGLAGRCATRQGEGSLIYATAAGVETTRVPAAPMRCAPAPTTWAHWTACGWTAAWLTARGRRIIGARQLQLEKTWHGHLEWRERDGRRRRRHQPDLLAGLTPEGRLLPVEVELAIKSTERLRSILALYGRWIAAGHTDAVIYVCANEKLAGRVLEHGEPLGLIPERRTLRVETLATVRHTAVDAHQENERKRDSGLVAVARS